LVVLSAAFLWQFNSSAASTIPNLDKLVHFGAFFVLAWTFHRAFPLPFAWGMLVLGSYGVAIEYIQSTLPYRSAEWEDLLADALGVVAYYACHYGWQRLRKGKRPK